MSDPRLLLDAYADEDALNPALKAQGVPVKYEEIAPAAFAALRAVLDLHPRNDYGFCDHCVEASLSFGAVDVHYPCPTVQAITKELEAR